MLTAKVMRTHMYTLLFSTTTLVISACNAEVSHYLQQVSQRQVAIPDDDGQYHEEHNEWDIRLSVPGEPGRDYPTLSGIPRTEFTCAGKEAGYYADLETNCQVFRVCTTGATFGFQSFLCPNGTLFNQQVFVCDWWMNVNCQTSQKYYQNNNQRFGQLRVGSQFMQDIRKMIMYPMENPYSQNQNVYNNQVMQIYRPPLGQLFGAAAFQNNGAQLKSYAPAQQLRAPLIQGNLVESSFAASTPNPQYVPQANAQLNSLNSHYSVNSHNADYTNGQLVQGPTAPYNGHAQFVGSRNQVSGQLINQQVTRQFGNQINGNYRVQSNQLSNTNNLTPRQQQLVQANRYPVGSTHNQQINALYNIGQAARYTSNQNIQPNNIQSGQLKQSEIAYYKQFNQPIQNEKQVIYPLPINQGQAGGFVLTQKSVVQTKQDLVSPPIVTKLPNPTYVPAKFISKTITINKNTSPARLTSAKTPLSKVTVKSWSVQTPKSAALIARPTNPPRKYLSPTKSSPFKVQTHSLIASASTSAPLYLAPLVKKPNNNTISITKHTHINTRHNNLTFTDILTKEKLDITVNKIVRDTSKLLDTGTSSKPEQIQRQRVQPSDVPLPKFIPPQKSTSDYEKITTYNPKSPESIAKTVFIPSGPAIAIKQKNIKSKTTFGNQVPQFRQRLVQAPQDNIAKVNDANTVTIKLTIPVKTAAYIFKTKNETEFERLEILHTGNSNFLVLTNARHPSYTHNKFIPLGKLIVSNISNSQAYVQDLLEKTLHAAHSYENALNDNFEKLNFLTTNTFGQQFKTLDQEDYNEISQKVTQANFQQQRMPGFSGAYTSSTQNQNTQRGSARYTEGSKTQQISQVQNQVQTTSVPERTGNFYSSTFYSGREPQTAAKLRVAPIASNRPQNQVVTNTQTELVSTVSNVTPTRVTELDEDEEKEIVTSSAVENFGTKESNEAEIFEQNVRPLSSPSPAKLQQAPELENTNQYNEADVENTESEDEEKHISYKADKAYVFYSRHPEGGPTKGNLIQQSASYTENENNGQKQIITTVQFIPSIGFQLDDERDHQKLLNTIRNGEITNAKLIQGEQGYSYNRPSSNLVQAGYSYPNPNNRVVEAVGYPRVTPATLYAGPSSYLAPQRSVGQLDGSGYVLAQQNAAPPSNTYVPAQQNAAPPTNTYIPAQQIAVQPTNTYVPAKLEEFDDNQGYPRVTPAIAFNY